MFLTTKGRYAIMAIIDMSMQNGLLPIRLVEIADRQQIVLAYLEQIFVKLRKNQLMAAVRSPGSWYKRIKLGENIKITKCLA